jgi:hypothetical protein
LGRQSFVNFPISYTSLRLASILPDAQTSGVIHNNSAFLMTTNHWYTLPPLFGMSPHLHGWLVQMELGIKSGDTLYLKMDGFACSPDGEYSYLFSSLVATSLLSGAPLTHEAIRMQVEQSTGIPVTSLIIERSLNLLNEAKLLHTMKPAAQLLPHLCSVKKDDGQVV